MERPSVISASRLVLTQREEKNSAAIASNESFGGWTKTFTDPRLCAAIVDAHAHAAMTGGMAGWQIALIAVGAAILGAIVAVLLDRVGC
jgi:hypothetical protein